MIRQSNRIGVVLGTEDRGTGTFRRRALVSRFATNRESAVGSARSLGRLQRQSVVRPPMGSTNWGGGGRICTLTTDACSTGQAGAASGAGVVKIWRNGCKNACSPYVSCTGNRCAVHRPHPNSHPTHFTMHHLNVSHPIISYPLLSHGFPFQPHPNPMPSHFHSQFHSIPPRPSQPIANNKSIRMWGLVERTPPSSPSHTHAAQKGGG